MSKQQPPKVKWSDFIIPPILIAGMTAVKDIYGLFILPEDPVFWIDIATQSGSYIISDLIVQYAIEKQIKSKFGREVSEMLFQPTLHGLTSSIITTNVHNQDVLAQLTQFQAGRFGSYLTNFIDGFTLHVLAQHLGSPLVDAINKN